MRVYIQANSCRADGNGIFSFEVEAKAITLQQEAVLSELFPNTAHAINTILAQEALIQSVIPEQTAMLISNKKPEPIKVTSQACKANH